MRLKTQQEHAEVRSRETAESFTVLAYEPRAQGLAPPSECSQSPSGRRSTGNAHRVEWLAARLLALVSCPYTAYELASGICAVGYEFLETLHGRSRGSATCRSEEPSDS